MADEVMEMDAPAPEKKAELEELLNTLIEAVKYCVEKTAALEDLVVNQFIGGINKLYDDNQRVVGIGDLRKKFGADFEDIMPLYLKDTETDDLFDRIYDLTKGMDGESLASKVKEVAEALRGRYEGLGALKPKAKVAAVEVAAKPELTPEPMSAEQELEAAIDKERKRGRRPYTGRD